MRYVIKKVKDGHMYPFFDVILSDFEIKVFGSNVFGRALIVQNLLSSHSIYFASA